MIKSVKNFFKNYRFQIINVTLIFYCLFLVILTSLPGSSVSKTSQIDKLYHMGAYGLLSFILYFFLIIQNKIQLLKKYPATFTLLLATAFGFANEVHQIFIPTRTFNKFDLLANLIGIVLTLGVIKIFLLVNKSYNFK